MKALSLFKRIAVREKFGVEFLQRNGIDAVEVIDPTLLLESYRDLLPHMEFLPIEEWLYAIASAKVVITDSFHATVFSMLFGKPFYVYISEPSKVFRISNLLDILGIKRRIVNDVDDAIAAPSINYETVNQRLSAYRESSLNYLKSILA